MSQGEIGAPVTERGTDLPHVGLLFGWDNSETCHLRNLVRTSSSHAIKQMIYEQFGIPIICQALSICPRDRILRDGSLVAAHYGGRIPQDESLVAAHYTNGGLSLRVIVSYRQVLCELYNDDSNESETDDEADWPEFSDEPESDSDTFKRPSRARAQVTLLTLLDFGISPIGHNNAIDAARDLINRIGAWCRHIALRVFRVTSVKSSLGDIEAVTNFLDHDDKISTQFEAVKTIVRIAKEGDQTAITALVRCLSSRLVYTPWEKGALKRYEILSLDDPCDTDPELDVRLAIIEGLSTLAEKGDSYVIVAVIKAMREARDPTGTAVSWKVEYGSLKTLVKVSERDDGDTLNAVTSFIGSMRCVTKYSAVETLVEISTMGDGRVSPSRQSLDDAAAGLRLCTICVLKMQLDQTRAKITLNGVAVAIRVVDLIRQFLGDLVEEQMG